MWFSRAVERREGEGRTLCELSFNPQSWPFNACYAFLTQALHHPFAATDFPGKIAHGPVLALGSPLKCMQVAQLLPAWNVGYFVASTVLASVV